MAKEETPKEAKFEEISSTEVNLEDAKSKEITPKSPKNEERPVPGPFPKSKKTKPTFRIDLPDNIEEIDHIEKDIKTYLDIPNDVRHVVLKVDHNKSYPTSPSASKICFDVILVSPSGIIPDENYIKEENRRYINISSEKIKYEATEDAGDSEEVKEAKEAEK